MDFKSIKENVKEKISKLFHDPKSLKIMKISLIVLIAVAVVTAGIIITVVLLNKDDPCTHADNNLDGICDLCGENLPPEASGGQPEDKIEAISRYTITANDGEGYTVTAPDSVIKGNSFSFTVAFSNYFDTSSAVVSVNGAAAILNDDGSYRADNIQENVVITVSGITRTHYGVAKLACLGAKIVGDDRVAVGGDYSFTLNIAECATGAPVVKVNGEIITAVGGVYTVTGLNKNVLIEVTGLTVPVVEAAYAADSGYTIVSNPTIVGEDFKFSVHIDSNYENHVPIVVKANNSVVESIDGIYTVPNAPKNIAITVEGVSLRETITISFENCDLEPITIYKATLWKGITPIRDGYMFNGWEDKYGHEVELNYMSDITLYASWITDDGINYIDHLTSIANKITKRSEAIKDKLWQMNIADKALADEYRQMLGHHTEHELASVKANATVDEFIARTEYVSSVVIGKNAFFGANDNAVRLFFTVDGELTTKGASELRFLSNGDDMNGIRYNIQNKNADNKTILDYSLEFGKYNFKELCDKYGKVTFWLSTNAEGMVAKLESKYLFIGALNADVESGGRCALYRIDIQNGMVFVNAEYAFDLSEAAYNGETEFSVDIHRLDIPSHEFAYIHVSDIYCGTADASLVKTEKTGEAFKIASMLSAGYIDGANGLVTFTRSDVSSSFAEDQLEGDKYHIQMKLTETKETVLDYIFTITPFNYKTYCEMYGSVSFMLSANYDTTVKIGSQQLFKFNNNKVTVTIQDGHIFVGSTYVCDLSEDVYNGTEALVLEVSRTSDAIFAEFNVSDLIAGPANPSLTVE